MRPRITGTETEFGLTLQKEADSKHLLDEHRALEDVVKQYSSPEVQFIGNFSSNGCRFYTDCGNHLEYATPEDFLSGTAANEIAGERFVYNALSKAREDGYMHDFSLNKRVIDDEGNTWGHHENYLVDRDKISFNAESLALLGLHLATINIFTGAGAVYTKRRGQLGFALAQKALDLSSDFVGDTTKNKPVVNLRDEPLASKRFARVHVTSGDANMSPWAIRMRLGTTSLILRLIENGYTLRHIRPEQPFHRVGLQVATDLTLQRTVTLTDYREVRPIDIQTELMLAAKEFVQKHELPPEEDIMLSEWERACDDMRKDPAKLADRVEWMAKYQLIHRYQERRRLRQLNQEAQSIDRHWGDLRPDSFGQKLRCGRWAPWMPSEELISKRETQPPENTRAALRGGFIARFALLPNSNNVGTNWAWVKVGSDQYKLGNPYKVTYPALEQVIAS